MDCKLVFCFVLIFAIGATEDLPGECPKVEPQAGFDLDKFAKEPWYLVEQTDSDADRCIKVEFSLTPQKTYHKTGVESDGDVINKIKTFTTPSSGTISVADGNESDDYIIVASDNDKYALVYKCDHDVSDNDHEEDVYIYVRESELANPTAAIEEAKRGLEGKGIQTTVFSRVDHTNCA